jgi:hypothetical protein
MLHKQAVSSAILTPTRATLAAVKENEYRRNAAETIELANRAASPADKFRLLGMAQGWLKLAERVQGQPAT